MYPILVWYGTQVLAPDLSQRAISKLSQSDWRERLVKNVKNESQRRFSRRRLAKWLSEERTWRLLVSPSVAGNDELVDSLSLRLAGRRPDILQHQDLAEYLLQLVIESFLVSLDPSYAIAVSHHQQTGQLERIEQVLDDHTAFRDNLLHLAPPVARIVESEIPNGSVACERLATLLVSFATSGVEAVRELVEYPPEWLRDGPTRLWVALGEFAGGFRLFEVAAKCFLRAADEGSIDRTRLLMLAAMNHFQEGEVNRAAELIDQASSSSTYEEYVRVVRALVAGDLRQLIASVSEDSEDILLLLMQARACLSLDEVDCAIAIAERALSLDSEMAGSRLILAEALQSRASAQRATSQRSDLARSVELALEARDLRRAWRGPSDDAVAIACRGSLMLHDEERVLQLGREAPEGVATAKEARSSHVLIQVAWVALDRGDIGAAQSALALLPNSFERTLMSGAILKATENVEAAHAALHDAYLLAPDDSGKRQVQFHLASMGEFPLPDQRELEEDDSAGSALILGTGEAVRGDTVSAIARLRAWRTRSLACAELLASILTTEGNHADAALTLADAGNRFHEPRLLVEAAKQSLAAHQPAQAEVYAEEALHSRVEHSEARRISLLMLIHLAEVEHNWTKAEKYARTLVNEFPSDTQGHWSLIGALYNSQLFEQAWSVLKGAGLRSETESEARAWLELATRHSDDPDLVDQVLDLADTYQSEEFGAAAIGAILRIPVGDEWPEVRVARFQAFMNGYTARFPDGQYLERIDFESPEELFESLRDRLEPGAREYQELVREVSLHRKPYVLIASAAGRPYAQAFLQRGAGCLTVSTGDSATLTEEIEAAATAVNGTVVMDASSLVTSSYIQDAWPAISGAFRSICILEPSRADILLSRDQIVEIGVDTIAWNPVVGAAILHTVPLEELEVLKDRARWVAARAIDLDLVAFSALSEGERSSDQRVLAALGPPDYAHSHGFALFSDDACLRALSRGMGVPSFGTVALIYALASQGRIAETSVNPLLQQLRRGYCVDLPPDSQQILALAEEENWAGGPGMFAFTRPSLWREGEGTLALFRACAEKAFAQNHDLLASWFAAGVLGLGSLVSPEHIPVVVAQLLISVQAISGSDPDQFSRLTQVARQMTERLGAADPTELALKSFLESAVTSFGPEMGTRVFLALTERFEGSDREVVRRLVFGV